MDITERARIAALQITTAIPVITIPTLEEFPAVRGARMRATMGTLATDPGATDITAMAHAVTETVYPVATVAVGAPAYLVATVAVGAPAYFGGYSSSRSPSVFGGYSNIYSSSIWGR